MPLSCFIPILLRIARQNPSLKSASHRKIGKEESKIWLRDRRHARVISAERMNMKIGFRKIGLIAVATGLMMAASAYANGAKGGGLDLINLSGNRPVITEKATAKVMECSMCKSEARIISVRDNKGRVVRAVPTATHGCPACTTTSTLVGHGKGKVEKRSHLCTAAAETLACCTR